MVSNAAWSNWRLACACVLLLGVAGAMPAKSESPSRPDGQTDDVDQANKRVIAKAVGPDEDTPENRKLADRPDIRAAFEVYQRAGGLAPKYRFAHAFGLTAGFSGGPLAGLIDKEASKSDIEQLKAHPAAFDLVCEPKQAAEKTPPEAARDPDVPAPPAFLRFSVDVPAGLWRSGKAQIQTMHIGEQGKLVTKWNVDLEHAAWGTPIYDRIARSYDEDVTSKSYASATGARTSVHATCQLEPYSKLFGAGG